MKTLNLLGLAFVCLVLTTATSCKKSTTTSGSCTGTGGSFTCNLDGGSFSGNTYNNTLLKATFQGIPAKRLDIRATASNGDQVVLTISDWRDGKTGNGFRTDTYYFDATQNPCNNDNTACIGAIFTIISTGGNFTSFPIPGSSSGSIVITACDEANHTISGTFSGNFSSPGGGGTSHAATNGTFTNLCYEVINQ